MFESVPASDSIIMELLISMNIGANFAIIIDSYYSVASFKTKKKKRKKSLQISNNFHCECTYKKVLMLTV